jgi:RNA polymerase-binding protein DksA
MVKRSPAKAGVRAAPSHKSPDKVIVKAIVKATAKPAAKLVKPVAKAMPAKAAAPVKAEPVKAAAAKAVAPVKVPPAAVQVKPSVVKAKAAPLPINGRPVPLASVPTDGKPRKNQAGLNARELENFRALLLGKRRELVGDMSSMERDALNAGGGTNLSNLPLHMADMGTDNYEQEFTLGLMEKDRKLLKEINHALAKIQDGSYGICQGTGLPISKARLEAQPWARFSIEYARKLEHGLTGRYSQEFGRVNEE